MGSDQSTCACHLSCNRCGHWKVDVFTREQIAEWLRAHPEPRIRTYGNLDPLGRRSICPHPCGGVR